MICVNNNVNKHRKRSIRACKIFESWGFVNQHLQESGLLSCRFRLGVAHLVLRLAQDPEPVEGLKVSPERRPQMVGVEARRADCS